MRQLFFYVAFGAFACSLGSASVIYNNGSPNQASADGMTDTLVAEDIPILAATTLTSFEFWDAEAGGAYNGSVSWGIFSDSSGVPGLAVAQGSASTAGQITRTGTGNTWFGFNEFDDVVNLTTSLTSGSLALNAGTYWLVLHNGANSNSAFQDFYWETTDNNTTNFGLGQELGVVAASPSSWVSTLQEHAFNISDGSTAAPEPITWLMMSSGVAGIALFRRRRT